MTPLAKKSIALLLALTGFAAVSVFGQTPTDSTASVLTSDSLSARLPVQALLQPSDTAVSAAAQDTLRASGRRGRLQKADSTTQRWPVPRKALWFSLIPGGGQIYNRQWWKLPFVYGALGTAAGIVVWNQQRMDEVITAIDEVRAGLPISNPKFVRLQNSEQTLILIRDGYRRQRDYAGFFFLLGYALQGVEAYVAAHLRHFNVTDNLALQVRPSLMMPPYGDLSAPRMGIALKFSLK